MRHDENLTPFAHAAQNRCFGCGQANSSGLQLEFLLAPDGTAVSLPTIHTIFEGHPGYLHGGIIATLLDEAMSKAVRAKGLTAMTRHMEIDYKRPVPSGVSLRWKVALCAAKAVSIGPKQNYLIPRGAPLPRVTDYSLRFGLNNRISRKGLKKSPTAIWNTGTPVGPSVCRPLILAAQNLVNHVDGFLGNRVERRNCL